MADEKKKGHEKQKPSIVDFADRIVEKLTELLTAGPETEAHEGLGEIDLPAPCGPGSKDVIDEMAESAPMTKLRRIVVVKPGDVDEVSRDKDEVQAQLRSLMAARNTDLENTIRQVFSAVHHARTAQDGASQLAALRLLDTLVAHASDGEREAFETVRRSVLAGTDNDLDTANFRLRQVFASRVGGTNIRLAYTTLATQFGEGYQLCPKAAHQIGKAVPMELSKCRDNCIDSRTTREGHVTCAYADWLRRTADNHKAVEDRLERVPHDLNNETLGTLKEGERSKPETVKSIEGQMDEVRSKYPETAAVSPETSFDTKGAGGVGHRDNPIKRIQDMLAKSTGAEGREEELEDAREDGVDYDDNTLEQMLEGEHDGFGDSELDLMVEELLERARPEK